MKKNIKSLTRKSRVSICISHHGNLNKTLKMIDHEISIAKNIRDKNNSGTVIKCLACILKCIPYYAFFRVEVYEISTLQWSLHFCWTKFNRIGVSLSCLWAILPHESQPLQDWWNISHIRTKTIPVSTEVVRVHHNGPIANYVGIGGEKFFQSRI